MIVVDASIVVDLLLGLPPHDATIARLLLAEAPNLFAPHLLDAEVAQVIRRHVRAGGIDAGDAVATLVALGALPIVRHPHLPFLERAFELRDNVTIYDALYLVLAETLGATLVTRDRALASVPGVRARVRVIA
ncbi:MAG: type II toxin-antitoxin system VapC family toxin [Deltaproteobacteria bacterium]